MTYKEKYELVSKGLSLACEFIRKYPPSDFSPYFEDSALMEVLCDPNDDEPRGTKYMYYFLNKGFEEENLNDIQATVETDREN